MSRYPTGVPTPYTTHVHPYPTRFHGGIWRRPAFGLPWVRSPFNVIRPSASRVYPPVPQTPPLVDSAGRVVGGMRGVGDWDTGSGVFRRPRLDGGGIFNEISGLGMSPDTQAFVGGAILAGGLVAYLIFRKKKMTANSRKAVPGWDVFLRGKKIDHIVHVEPTLHAALGLPPAGAAEVKATLVRDGYDPQIVVRRGKTHKSNRSKRRKR